jgi:hypothetical protein
MAGAGAGDTDLRCFRALLVGLRRFGVVGRTGITVGAFLLLRRRCVITGGCSSCSKSGVSSRNGSILSKAGDDDILVLLRNSVFRANRCELQQKLEGYIQFQVRRAKIFYQTRQARLRCCWEVGGWRRRRHFLWGFKIDAFELLAKCWRG